VVRLPARKTPLLEALIYRALVRPALSRTFHRVALNPGAPRPRPDSPTLIYSNHPSWWDGYMAFVLTDEVWRCESYLMMEEPQLERYGFFRFCGAFSVDRHDPREGLRSVAYAADLLRQPQRVVWIFPQGTITPAAQRPLQTFAGAALIAKRVAQSGGALRCIPMALRFEFGGEQRPEALIRLGEPHTVAGSVVTRILHAEMDARLTATMDQLDGDIVGGAIAAYPTLLHGTPSVNVRWDRARALVGLR
jgi:1-acyl-sn-glycerol-3-phosphate acyltransferase